MRGANAYRSLNEAHDRIDDGAALPGTRYEAVRDTQYGVDDRMAQDAATRPGSDQARPTLENRMDAIEARLATLDKELTAIRAEVRVPETGAAYQYSEADIDRLFALHGQPDAEPSTSRPTETRDYVGPQSWTEHGGMAEQQASAMDWHKHILEERQKQAAEHMRPADQMTPEDLSVLNAAREHETQSQQQQDKERGQAHGYPAP